MPCLVIMKGPRGALNLRGLALLTFSFAWSIGKLYDFVDYRDAQRAFQGRNRPRRAAESICAEDDALPLRFFR